MNESLNKIFLRAGQGILAAGLVVLNEVSGYKAFDIFPVNLACTIDPTCRLLTEDEIALSRPYFGDDIDYSKVRRFERRGLTYLFGKENVVMYVTDASNIYNGKAYEKFEDDPLQLEAFLIHEMAHIWQNQNQTHNENDRIYKYDMAAFEKFMEYGKEQQATILQHIHLLRSRVETNQGATSFTCHALNAREDLAAQILPLQKTGCLTPTLEA